MTTEIQTIDKEAHLSKSQIKALNLIDMIESELTKHTENKRRWFIKEELQDITMHSITALVEKGYIEKIDICKIPYYRRK